MAEEVKKSKGTKGARFKNFAKGILVENPLFVMVLGTCPALATTTSIEAAIGMGILFSIVLICSNVLISSLRKVIPDEIRTPAYIVVIATFVTIVKMMTNAFLPELYATLGVFISLIVVNCIVLGRAEAYASKNTVLDSLLDGCGMGLGYTLALISIAFFREVLGSGMITFGKIFPFIPLFHIPLLKYTITVGEATKVIYDYSIPVLQQPTGAFIIFGLVMAIIGFVNVRKSEKAAFLKRTKVAPVKVDDDPKVNQMRVIFAVVTAFVGCVAGFMMFLSPLSIDASWSQIYFGYDVYLGATPAFVGFILTFIAAILAGVSAIFAKNWNGKYITLNIVCALLGVIGATLILSTSGLFTLINPAVENAVLGHGAILGGVFAILTAISAIAGLIVPGLYDSLLVARQAKEVK